MSKHIPKKRWGQNFLVDSNVINKIISSIDIKPNDSILEVGPGKGAITTLLAEKVKKITAIEIDSNLCKSLEDKNISNLEIINNDILKTDLSKIDSNIIIGNLPYYITTPILFKIFKSTLNWEKIYFTMQKEVAERITGKPNTKSYGRLTIMCQIFSNTKILFNISPQVFRPIPKVESSFLEFSKNTDFQINDYMRFEEIIRKIFNQRRKKFKNCISPEMNLNLSENLELLDKRPEQITIQEYMDLIN
jgi:16S rRNA (adenine1518-N6/adenine1519-N6)-dimethyltransferase